ncbi:hypothetical protein GSU68_19590 (plasmid) [Rathayibacter sp. VKM Ac-2759]|uniref:hypothetical protein n=1 Tax=Rathayibacter sp. VKM Ac-2759 TaxID=2609252 RepID=UPI0013184C8A|nr:hypothetical protein [Rathayibacter sp. VKM Ac-2759]QHC68923.1 hypothetical protein GSU68_19590 [Rathayibacter sp. VKM Ac-2759]
MTISNTPGLRSYEEAMRSSETDVVSTLRDMLGAKLVAYIGSVNETRAVRQWSEGSRQPGADTLQRLRLAYQVAGLIAEREQSRVIQAWFQGLNPLLEDVSPARLLREGDADEVGPRVLAAARAFISV